MKRQNPLFTPFGAVLTILLLAGVGLSIWSSGGKAFSPGPLSAQNRAVIARQGFESHADFESHCSLCHAPLETTQDKLCLACHEDINLQIFAGDGTHSLIENVNLCARCHPDHRGNEFDPTASAFSLFDHSQTVFSLTWHQVNYDTNSIECAACHQVESDFSAPNTKCESCHSDHDPDFILQHNRKFSPDCLICHNGFDRMTDLNHQNTAFPLDGQHIKVSCVECHKLTNAAHQDQIGSGWVSYPAGSGAISSDPFSNTPSECAQCHKEPEAHQGLFAGACSDCHTTTGWIPAMLEGRLFEHAERSGFSLSRHTRDYENQPMICGECHQTELIDFDLTACITCHASSLDRAAFLQEHQEQFGGNCLDCHDGIDRMSDFDHARFFPLDGRHGGLECTSCHQEKNFIGTASECAVCHIEPDIHAGFFGLQCQYCHTAQAWAPAQLLTHRFPLDHGSQGESDCQICHPGRYSDITCYGCHDHQPDLIAASHSRAGIAMDQLANCTGCHPDGFIELQE